MTDSDTEQPQKNFICARLPNRKWLHSKWIGLPAIAAVFVFMAVMSWRKWTDIVVDFGSQLYIPWRLNHGNVLYRDLIYVVGGPFSQYFNALLFRLFGASFATLIWSNLLFTGGLLVVIYCRFLKAADAWTATTICLAIVLVFAFGFYDFNNFNYITPYSHELFHGFLLSVAALIFLTDWLTKRESRYVVATGLCYGLVFLTKPDMFLALSGAVFAAIALAIKNRHCRWISLSLFVMASLGGPLIFLVYFCRHENFQESLRAVAFAWEPLTKRVANQYFYRWCLGLDRPGMHLGYILTWSSSALLFFAVCIAAARKAIFAVIAVLLIFASVLCADWTQIGYALPLLGITSCLFLWFNRWKRPIHNASVFPMLWSVFALVLLVKLGFFCRVWGYGFILAMPAFVTGIYFLLWLFPSWLETRHFNPRIFRLLVWAMLMCACAQLARTTIVNYVAVNYAVGSGANEIKTVSYVSYPRGQDVAAGIKWLDANTSPSATLAVVPEGTMINFLTRRINPNGCLAWSPAELAVFGQANLNSRFEKSPPDYVMLLQRSSREFGLEYFGRQPEFGSELMQWIQKNYTIAYQVGDKPLAGSAENDHYSFGLQILRYTPANDKNATIPARK